MTPANTEGLTQLEPGLVRLVAPNPSPMTFRGTNSYLLGQDRLIVIDPGPALPAHFKALMAAIKGRPVSHILVTHSHLDHSPLARPLSEVLQAPVCAFGDAASGRSAVMTELAASGLAGGGEGIDHDFQPDHRLGDGEEIPGDGYHLTARQTPGHLGNHLCFDRGDVLFSGDHIMGWATSLVSPPDGDLTDFRTSCQRLLDLGPRRLLPGHGDTVEDGTARIRWILSHRQDRELQILDRLSFGPQTAQQLTQALYHDVAPALWPAAERNVFAHLVDLTTRNLIQPRTALGISAQFGRA